MYYSTYSWLFSTNSLPFNLYELIAHNSNIYIQNKVQNSLAIQIPSGIPNFRSLCKDRAFDLLSLAFNDNLGGPLDFMLPFDRILNYLYNT